jgi:hypothetical protein
LSRSPPPPLPPSPPPRPAPRRLPHPTPLAQVSNNVKLGNFSVEQIQGQLLRANVTELVDQVGELGEQAGEGAELAQKFFEQITGDLQASRLRFEPASNGTAPWANLNFGNVGSGRSRGSQENSRKKASGNATSPWWKFWSNGNESVAKGRVDGLVQPTKPKNGTANASWWLPPRWRAGGRQREAVGQRKKSRR